MDFLLDSRQREFQAAVREYVARRVEPVASQLDREGKCPQEFLHDLAGLGMLGGERDFIAYVAGLEEIARTWASLAAIVSIHNSLVRSPIERFGTDQQRKKHLATLASGEHIGCYAFAEPGAGSDAGSIQTTATAEGEGFLLTGRKRFVTSGRRARVAVVYASTDASRGRDGLTAFIVDMTAPGVAVGKTDEKLGLRAAETVELTFTNCRLSRADQLGELNQGFPLARSVVEAARIDIAALAVGIAQACLDKSIGQARQRKQFGKPIAEFEAIQWMLADMSTEIDAARLLTYQAAALQAQNPDEPTLTMKASMAKLFASEAANRAAYNAIQIFGGHGYLAEAPVERYFRDARAMTLYAETSEISRLVIERELARAMPPSS